jgi:NADP-dependent 3-hydroxy acid dehydrogenase YdfG
MNTNTNNNQVAIVTGASSGIGLGITRALIQHGYRVVANSRNISKSKELKPSSDLILVDGDIGKMESAIKVADAAIKNFDHIDLLVNNAGIYITKPFTDYAPADFDLMIGTNVAGYFSSRKEWSRKCANRSPAILWGSRRYWWISRWLARRLRCL